MPFQDVPFMLIAAAAFLVLGIALMIKDRRQRVQLAARRYHYARTDSVIYYDRLQDLTTETRLCVRRLLEEDGKKFMYGYASVLDRTREIRMTFFGITGPDVVVTFPLSILDMKGPKQERALRKQMAVKDCECSSGRVSYAAAA